MSLKLDHIRPAAGTEAKGAVRPEAGARVRAAVIGCTGIVGQQFLRLLDGHPSIELGALAASSKSAGKAYADAMAWAVEGDVPDQARTMKVIEAHPEALAASGATIFFSALPASLAGPIETDLRGRGFAVFSNASAHRTDPKVPILVPEINAGHLDLARDQAARYGGFIVAGPNCSTSGLVMVLKPLAAFGPKRVSVTTFQSISGAGRRGLAAMDIAGNVIPFIRNEEEKMESETRKILGNLDGGEIKLFASDIRASCCRVPVREGHLLSIEVEFGTAPEPESVRAALTGFRGMPQILGLPTAPERPLLLRTEEDRPQPALDLQAGFPERARGMAVSVGRLRFKGSSLRLFALVHNTVRGAAGGCVLSAELALAEGIIR
jgi:aspartate-semialdehyde dehydrogenase